MFAPSIAAVGSLIFLPALTILKLLMHFHSVPNRKRKCRVYNTKASICQLPKSQPHAFTHTHPMILIQCLTMASLINTCVNCKDEITEHDEALQCYVFCGNRFPFSYVSIDNNKKHILNYLIDILNFQWSGVSCAIGTPNLNGCTLKIHWHTSG